MNAQIEDFETGYVGITIALKEQEIDTLIERLTDLKTGKADHFHFRNEKMSEGGGLADLEFSIASPEEIDNLIIM